MKSPQNKMISADQLETKKLGKRVEPTESEDSPKDAAPKLHKFYFPHYRRNVLAETMEEAEQIIKDSTKINS